MTPTFVLYHARCADGFGAAFAAWQALGDSAVYLPVSYGNPVPEEVTDGSRVYIVDFSYPRPELEALAARVQSLQVLDHHATAQEALKGLPYAHFDMTKSGAVLTWEHFFPGQPVPELLLYVQDRDLWQWKLSESEAVSAGLQLHPFDFEGWKGLNVESLKTEGQVALRFKQQLVARAARDAYWQEIGGYRIPVVNATMFGSEIAHRMLELHPDAPFVAFFYDKEHERGWGLRSRPGFDCSAIAKLFGGGGHPNAAGFRQLKSDLAKEATEAAAAN